ncbi:MAG: SRPBCC family protein [Pyrinomonadaceae bacterium]|nr:SRPBCC family protein [Pyrinomonadaceae bacterium]
MRLAAEEAGLISNQDAQEQRGRDESSASSASSGGVNISEWERWGSAIGGGALAVFGVSRLLTHKSLTGAVLALVGGSLIYRGTTGHCTMYQALGFNTSEAGDNPNVSVRAGKGFKVEKSVAINKSPEELYRFWRNFENLPRFMNHLEAVQETGGNRSHWVAKAPAGSTVQWDAEIYNEKENELIAWRSLEGADVDNAGSVRFEADPAGRGTIVRVTLKYDPPGGALGKIVAKLFGEAPDQQIDEDLRRFKQLMEAGEMPTTDGQPSGRSATAGNA